MAILYPGDPYAQPGDEPLYEVIPYYDADDDSSGDSSDEEEDPEEDSEEEDPEEDPMEEEYPDELAANPAYVEQDIDAMIDQIEGAAVIVVSDDETDLEVESDVEDPRYRIRSLDQPMPPPSHQVYRHPDGPLWKYTPRKSVPQIRRDDVFTFAVPLQGAGFGAPGAGTSAAGAAATAAADREYSEMMRAMERMGVHAHATDRRLLAMDADVQVTGARVRRIDMEVDSHDRIIDHLQDDLAATQRELATVHGHLAAVDQAAREAAHLARQALEEDRAFRRRLASFYQLPPDC